MREKPYTFTAKKNCILRVEGDYAFNFASNPNVYFTQDVDVTGVTLSQTEAAMTVGGETLTLTPTVAPSNATNKTVTWTTSDASVATVADGVVTAVAAGAATITATATNGTDDTSDDFSATCEVTVSNPLSLSEATDNSTAISTANGKVNDVTLTRTLRTGGYNTFAVPFAIGSSKLTELGITAKKLTASDFNTSTGVLSLTFANATDIEAGKPYLVKVASAVENPTFEGVTVSSSTTPTETTAVDFVPTLGATDIASNGKNILILGASNTFYFAPAEASQMKGFRAYFLLRGGAAASARAFVLDFGDGQTTGIISLKADGTANYTEGIYTLDGRKLQNLPTKNGVYIVNGKKVIK